MAKRNTVRINMEMLDGYLKAKNIHPKDFCEKQLGFSDGWYYGIRKKGGRGVKVLVAQLIARIIGVEYETLVIDEKNVVKKETINAKIDAGREHGNPSITAGASPRPTEKEEEKPLVIKYVETVEKLNGAKKTIGCLEKELDELKQERIELLFSADQRGEELKEAREDLKQLEKAHNKTMELHGAVIKELMAQTLSISKDDLLNILISATDQSMYKEFAKGAAYVVNNLLTKCKKQTEEMKDD